MLVAGVDLSGRTTGVTALAFLAGDSDSGPALESSPLEVGFTGPSGDGNLVAELVRRGPSLTALDAPLSLPHAVTCRDADCPRCFPKAGAAASYSTRELERVERWRGVSPTMKGPMPVAMIAAIAFRGIYLRRAIERQGLRVIETWPMAVYRRLDARTPTSGGAPSLSGPARHSLLSRAIPNVEGSVGLSASIDSLDAIAAALSAWSVVLGEASSVRSSEMPDEGAIFLPAG